MLPTKPKSKGPLLVPCPTCRKETPWANNPYRPFCSERCKLVDLGNWAEGKYQVQGSDSPSSEEEPS